MRRPFVWTAVLALFAACAYGSSAFDADWYIQPEKPNMQMDENNTPEIIFGYTVPSLNDRKWIQVTLFQQDCVTPANDASLYQESSFSDGLLQVQVLVSEETIVESPYWIQQEGNASMGYIDFCLRIDLMYDLESENFHESVRFARKSVNAIEQRL